MPVSFYEEWHEQQARKAAERRALIEQAQAWVGCRVWVTYGGMLLSSDYGEVERIDEHGRVFILVGYDSNDQPCYCIVDVTLLGQKVTRADGKPF